MGRTAKLAAFTLLGFVATGLIYGCLVFGALQTIRSRSGRSPESYMDVAFLVMLPAAFFLGSTLTGYLGHAHFRTRLDLIGVSPGLYVSLVLIVPNIIMPTPDRWAAIFAVSPALSWFLTSWAGVGLGSYVRSRRVRNRPSSLSRGAG